MSKQWFQVNQEDPNSRWTKGSTTAETAGVVVTTTAASQVQLYMGAGPAAGSGAPLALESQAECSVHMGPVSGQEAKSQDVKMTVAETGRLLSAAESKAFLAVGSDELNQQLIDAVYKKDVKTVQALLDHGVNPNIHSDYAYLLYEAVAMSSSLDMIQALLRGGANPFVASGDPEFKTAVDLALYAFPVDDYIKPITDYFNSPEFTELCSARGYMPPASLQVEAVQAGRGDDAILLPPPLSHELLLVAAARDQEADDVGELPPPLPHELLLVGASGDHQPQSE